MIFLNIVLSIAWLILTILMPNMLCGYSYTELIDIINDKDQRDLTETLKLINADGKNSAQIASEKLFLSIALSVILLVVVVIIMKAPKIYENIINKVKVREKKSVNNLIKNDVSNSSTEKIITEPQKTISNEDSDENFDEKLLKNAYNQEYSQKDIQFNQSITYTSVDIDNSKVVLNLKIINKLVMTKFKLLSTDFSIMVNDLPLSASGFLVKNKVVTNIFIKEATTSLVKVIFDVKKDKETLKEISVMYMGKILEIGKPIHIVKNTVVVNN